METFNLISGICSILGLLISFYTANKVYKLTNIDKRKNTQIGIGKKIKQKVNDDK